MARNSSAAAGFRRRHRIVDAVSAGGIVYRRAAEELQIVLCGHPSEGVWVLPKGTPEAGETLEQTALREVREETGLEALIEGKAGQIDYWFSRPAQRVRIHKHVHHYIMVPTGGDLALHDAEFEAVRWFSLQEAESSLSYANELQILRQAVALIELPRDACEHDLLESSEQRRQWGQA